MCEDVCRLWLCGEQIAFRHEDSKRKGRCHAGHLCQWPSARSKQLPSDLAALTAPAGFEKSGPCAEGEVWVFGACTRYLEEGRQEGGDSAPLL